jgi:mono/diheme cytochrome c family protein
VLFRSAPAPFVPDTTRDATWNRGAYLVRGLGHCAACHSARDSLGGGNPLDLQGGLIPVQNWYAPSLSSAREAGVAHWPREEVIALLRTGTSKLGQVTGPMAEVVQHSTQHLSDADLSAMTAYLQALPQSAGATDAPATPGPVPERVAARGAELYGSRCAGCHGERGEGVTAAYPALAGNRAVTLANPANAIQMVLYGGFGPATPGNPRPFGMPPYVLALSDEDIAAVVTHIRGQWGNQAAAVTTVDIARVRGVGR